MLELVIYFRSPQVQWSGKVQDADVIARHPVPFEWLARAKALQIMTDLNAQRCGYFLMRDGAIVPESDYAQIAPDSKGVA